MTSTQRQALEYVRNTNCGATKVNFVIDFEPIGNLLWGEITAFHWAEINSDGKIVLTKYGKFQLEAGAVPWAKR